MAVEYQIEVYGSDNQRKAIFDKAFNIQLTETLNRGGQLEFSLAGKDEKVTFENIGGANYVKLFRNGDLYWSGQIINSSTVIDTNGAYIAVSCIGWFELLQYRFTNESYSSTDAGAIAWDMIDVSQTQTNGDFGITEGSITATTNRDRVYENAQIAESIINLSECYNGFDFEINASRVFNVYSRKGSDKTDSVILKTDGQNMNIQKVDFKIDHGSVVNDVLAIGDADKTATASHTGSQEYFGLREKIISQTNWKKTTTIQAHANEEIRVNQWSKYDIEVNLLPGASSPDFSDWEIGDIILLKVEYGDMAFNNSVRIYANTIAVGNDGEENIQLKVNKVV